jgi:hypothetical protein
MRMLLFFSLLLLSLTVVYVDLSVFNEDFFNVSAVQSTGGINVYWDRACTVKVQSISWGVLSLGGSKEVVVYVRNEANITLFLLLTTATWNPTTAKQYLYFSWSSEDIRIAKGGVVAVKQRLTVSYSTRGIANFGFNINFIGREYPPGDTNKDYTINVLDLIFIAGRLGIGPTNPLWDPIADVNLDGRIDVLDAIEAAKNLGKTFEP